MTAARTWAVGIAVVALTVTGLVVEYLARSSGFWVTATEVAVIVVYAVSAGLMWLSPESRPNAVRLGLTAAVIGLAALDTDVFWAAGGYWLQLGWAIQPFYLPLMAAVLLSYPSSRVTSRSGRLLVGAAWVWASHRLIGGLFWDPQRAGASDEGRWLTLYANNALTDGIMNAGALTQLGLLVWFVVLQRRRWREAHGAARPTTRLVAGVATALAVAGGSRTVIAYLVGWGVLGVWANAASLALTTASGAAAGVILLVSALRSAVRRTAVVERLLAAAGDPTAVQAALRTELADPTLAVTFLLGDGWVDADGRPVTPPVDDPPRRIVRELAERDGQATARIEADESVMGDPGRLRVTLAAASLILDNTRLAVERNQHLAELAAAQSRIVEAGAQQRRQLERDLHDGAQQSLLGVAATLSRATLAADASAMNVVVQDAREQLSAALAELRQLAHGIHPAALAQGGLAVAVAGLAARIDRVVLRMDPDLQNGRRLPAAAESTAYFVVAEATTNAVKYGGAGPICVEVRCDDGVLGVTVDDDGNGGAALVPGGGLAGLADRVRALGGEFGLTAADGGGTRVWARLPVSGGAT